MQDVARPPSDGELLARIGRGDADAIADLYDRYAALLLAVALRIVRDRAEAEDLVHDAFVVVGERANLYAAERGTVGAWLVTLTRNLSIDRVRRRGRRHAIDRDVLPHEARSHAEPAAPDPESAVLGASECVRVRRALDALPSSQRMTLELSFFGGLSYPEIAALESVPLGTIKSRAARALETLRTVLTRESA